MYFNDSNNIASQAPKNFDSKNVVNIFSNDNKEIMDQMKSYYEGVKEFSKKSMNVTTYDEEYFANNLQSFNNYLKKNANKGEKTKHTFYYLSKEEKERRAGINQEAREIMSNLNAVYYTTSSILQEFLDKQRGTHIALDRVTFTVSNIGVTSFDEAVNASKIYLTGTKEEKQAYFEKSLREALNVMKELSYRKSDKEFLNYCKKNILTIFALEDMEGKKLKDFEKDFGVKVPEDIEKEIQFYGNKITLVGNIINRLGTMANPYYKELDERNQEFLDAVAMHDELDGELADVVSGRDDGGLKSCYDYAAIASLNPNHVEDMEHYLGLYKETHPDIVFLKKNGKEFKSINELAKYVIKGNNALASSNGKFVGLVSNNYDGYNVPDFNTTLDLNLKDDPNAVFNNLKTMVDDLDSIFSSNHQEFKDLKAYVKDMDRIHQEGKSYDEILKDTKNLATKYLESKLLKTAPSRTNRTNNRIEFMGKLINSINAYNESTLEKVNSLNKDNEIEAINDTKIKVTIEIENVEEEKTSIIPDEQALEMPQKEI